ncbi:MAG TPA: DUF4139 domain-containing protein [Kofleriaceae bacterium]|jgi:hypothetical protein
MIKARQLGVGSVGLVGLFVLGSVLWSSRADRQKKPADDMTPTATAITIYSAGGSVVSGVIDPTALHSRRLRLPATAAAINLSQGNQSLKWFTVQPVDETKETKKDAADRYKLIGLPSLNPGELKLNYALPEITWTLGLNAQIINSKSVSLQLVATVNMNTSEEYRNCDVTLVLNNAVSVEALSGAAFKLSAFDLYPHRNITYNLGNQVMDYSFVREWNADNDKDEVHVLLQVKNPFSVDLNQTSSSVEANQIIVESGTIGSQSRPGEAVSLPAGIDDTISTFRSVKITEATDKRLLPFNHHISYEITNHSNQEKTLRLVTSRVLGNEHRSVYHFKQPPDATPENTLVWILKLAPGSTGIVEYDFDADVKDVEGENGFEQGG